MGLTKIRATQISNLDYKQSCKVLTNTDVTLAGGAPVEVDGVSVMAGDRVLVIGQTARAQNGIYRVQTSGTGANGTWIRTTDADQTGEVLAGMIVMVTEGMVYKDTQWKLITNDPITIGVTELDFELNSAFAFGNIFANGVSVIANTVGDAVTFTAGNNISITGNAQSQTISFDVTGISLTSISDGTSNVTVTGSGSNVIVGVGGNTISTFTTDSLVVAGSILGNGAALTGINVFSNVAISGGTAVLADSISDTLTLIAGDGISLTGNADADSIIIALTGSGDSIFVTGGDMGTVTEEVTQSQDLGEVDEAITTETDMGTIVSSGLIYPDQLLLPSYSVAQLANLDAAPSAQMVYCTDDAGGAVPAFSDGTNWRRVTDRAIVS